MLPRGDRHTLVSLVPRGDRKTSGSALRVALASAAQPQFQKFDPNDASNHVKLGSG